MILLISYLLGTKFLCYIRLLFVDCLEFIDIWIDLLVCYLSIGKLKCLQSINMFTEPDLFGRIYLFHFSTYIF